MTNIKFMDNRLNVKVMDDQLNVKVMDYMLILLIYLQSPGIYI